MKSQRTITLLTLAAFLCFQIILEAQQLPLFAQFRENNDYINPAYVSNDYLTYEYNLKLAASYRMQWIEKPLTPRTQTVKAEYLIPNDGGVSLLTGGHIINDRNGPSGFTGIYGRLAGVIAPKGGDPFFGGLSVGLTFGAIQYRLDASNIRFYEKGDAFSETNQTQIIPDAGMGVFYYTKLKRKRRRSPNIFYIGASIPQILGLDLRYKSNNGEFLVDRLQYFYGVAGYHLTLSDQSYLEFSSWAKFVKGAPFHSDFNIQFQMQEFMWLGGGLSTAKNFHMEVGFFIGGNYQDSNCVKIGYGFEHNWSTFGSVFRTTHEINVAYLIDNL